MFGACCEVGNVDVETCAFLHYTHPALSELMTQCKLLGYRLSILNLV